jgi:hypothetical protein
MAGLSTFNGPHQNVSYHAAQAAYTGQIPLNEKMCPTHRFAAGVRKLGIAVRKVRGARDESDELIRLADAVAGFVRDALEGSSVMQALFDQALRRGVIRKV